MSEWGDDYDTLTDDNPPLEVQTGEAATLYYGSVDEFVREYLIHHYKRPINGRNRCWAAEWWKYEEAIVRLEALWRAWEHLRMDPATGLSIWWRDHADHHMPALMDPDGVFTGVEDTCRRGEPLPYAPPPEGLFPETRAPLDEKSKPSGSCSSGQT